MGFVNNGVAIENNDNLIINGYQPDGIAVNGKVIYESVQIALPSRNLIPSQFFAWESGERSTSTGLKQDFASRIRLIDLLPVSSQSFFINTFYNPYLFVFRTFDINKNFIRSIGARTNNSILTLNVEEVYLGISIHNSTSETGVNFETFKTLFENGSIKPFMTLSTETDRTFVPYQPGIAAPDIPGEILPTEILLSGAAIVTLAVGATLQVAATIYPENATNKTVTWKSSNTAYVTVDQTGLLKRITKGSTTIMATTANGITAMKIIS